MKGANLEAERVEASIRGWPQAPFQTKRETDANYKRMLRYGLEPDHARAVRLGVASHNLFDLCYALVLAEARGVRDRVQFEMLEGMANHLRRALRERAPDLVLYAPACRREDFVHAIGYLIRRLDENTGPENFLRHAFRLAVDSDEWRALERGVPRLLRRDPGAAGRLPPHAGPAAASTAGAPRRRSLAPLRERAGHRLRAAPPRGLGRVDPRRVARALRRARGRRAPRDRRTRAPRPPRRGP